MSVWGVDEADALAAAPSYVKPPKPPAKFSAWSAIPRGVAEAGAQVGASVADLIGGYGQVMGAYPELMGAPLTDAQRKQADQARAKLKGQGMELDLGDPSREWGRALRPDAQDASTAEQVLYGFARGAAKVVGGAVLAGPAGVVAAGAEEGMSAADDLKKQGVGFEARAKAGAVQGAGLALAALPAAGATLKSTAALYLAGGPGGYVAQQALTREILRNAGHADIAQQYDPFDPVGLAIASLIPAPFAVYGLRANKRAAAAKAAEDFRAGPVPSEPTAVAAAVQDAMPRDVVDAARVSYLAERRADSNIGTAADSAAHEVALGKAEAQMARGEPVNVLDVAPRGITPAEREANFRAWFGESQIRDAEGNPLVVYHGTGRVFDAFSNDALGANTGVADAREGFFFSSSGRDASEYAWKDGDPGSVMPVYLRMENPYISDMVVTAANNRQFAEVLKKAKADGHDGVAAFLDTFGRESSVYVVFDPKQVKSASGNSGRFDPNSPSLTDPITELAQAVDQLRAAMRQDDGAAVSAKAAAPKATAPKAAADAAAPEKAAPTSAAATDSATPGAKAETTSAQARVAQVEAEMPDMMVMLDGMEKPMPLSEFMAAVKAEADEMKADAPLVKTLAQCAILNG